MAALSAARNTAAKEGIKLVAHPVKASAVIYEGALVCLDAGYLKPAVTATGLKVVGRAVKSVTGTASDGGVTCEVHEGVFKWANGESITQASAGAICYAADDATVFTTSTGKSIAGVIALVESDGVWVESGLALSAALAS